MLKISTIRNSIAQRSRNKQAIKEGYKVFKSKSGIYTVHIRKTPNFIVNDYINIKSYKNGNLLKEITTRTIYNKKKLLIERGTDITFFDKAQSELIYNRFELDPQHKSHKFCALKETERGDFISARFSEVKSGKVVYQQVFNSDGSKRFKGFDDKSFDIIRDARGFYSYIYNIARRMSEAKNKP